jgi:phosphatidylglycerophosphate synthase
MSSSTCSPSNPPPWLSEVKDLYQQSRKPHDIFWNTYVSRPAAAFVLYFVRRTTLTPNQVTFASLGVAGFGAFMLLAWRTWAGLFASALVWQFSYVLDCLDGQLARLKSMTSPVGAHLDFLMDELKAFMLLAAVTIRLWLQKDEPNVLVTGLFGLAIVASAISLTTFMRRPEYAPPPAKTGFEPPPPLPNDPAKLVVVLAMRAAKFIVHYPSYFVFVALVNRVELYFYAYIVVHALYLGQCLAQIVLRLGRPGGQS